MAKFDLPELNQTLRAMRIPHSNYKLAYERGKSLFRLKDQGMSASGIMVFGDSGVGKTTLTKALVDYGVKHFGRDSVMRTQLSSAATVKSITSNLLHGFGDPFPRSGTGDALIQRLSDVITKRGCRLIIIDEFQHLIPGGEPSKALIDTILNSFKILDDAEVSYLLAGMESIMQLWHSDKQIRSRFQSTYFLDIPRLPKDIRTWRGIVNAYLHVMEKFGVTVECDDLDGRLYSATKGAMRPLMLILTTAACRAADDDSDVITNEHLREATAQQVDKQDGLINAFDVDALEVAQYNERCHSSRVLAPSRRGLSDIIAT